MFKVTFTDTLSGKVVYEFGTQPNPKIRTSSDALNAALKVAALTGLRFDRYVTHKVTAI